MLAARKLAASISFSRDTLAEEQERFEAALAACPDVTVKDVSFVLRRFVGNEVNVIRFVATLVGARTHTNDILTERDFIRALATHMRAIRTQDSTLLQLCVHTLCTLLETAADTRLPSDLDDAIVHLLIEGSSCEHSVLRLYIANTHLWFPDHVKKSLRNTYYGDKIHAKFAELLTTLPLDDALRTADTIAAISNSSPRNVATHLFREGPVKWFSTCMQTGNGAMQQASAIVIGRVPTTANKQTLDLFVEYVNRLSESLDEKGIDALRILAIKSDIPAKVALIEAKGPLSALIQILESKGPKISKTTRPGVKTTSTIADKHSRTKKLPSETDSGLAFASIKASAAGAIGIIAAPLTPDEQKQTMIRDGKLLLALGTLLQSESEEEAYASASAVAAIADNASPATKYWMVSSPGFLVSLKFPLYSEDARTLRETALAIRNISVGAGDITQNVIIDITGFVERLVEISTVEEEVTSSYTCEVLCELVKSSPNNRATLFKVRNFEQVLSNIASTNNKLSVAAKIALASISSGRI